MNIKIVSTFSDQYYEKYSKYFVASLKKYLKDDIEVILYTDSIVINENHIKSVNLDKSCPELLEFKKRNHHRIVENFMFDGITFAHKSYAIAHAGLNSNSDFLIWLDGDSELIGEINQNYFLSKLPSNYYTYYFGRPGTYSETGFIAFDLRNPNSKTFFTKIKDYYDTDKIYSLSGYTDCHVFDAVRQEMENNNLIKGCNLTPDQQKNHFNGFFRGYILHLKGSKKTVRKKHLKKAGVII